MLKITKTCFSTICTALLLSGCVDGAYYHDYPVARPYYVSHHRPAVAAASSSSSSSSSASASNSVVIYNNNTQQQANYPSSSRPSNHGGPRAYRDRPRGEQPGRRMPALPFHQPHRGGPAAQPAMPTGDAHPISPPTRDHHRGGRPEAPTSQPQPAEPPHAAPPAEQPSSPPPQKEELTPPTAPTPPAPPEPPATPPEPPAAKLEAPTALPAPADPSPATEEKPAQ